MSELKLTCVYFNGDHDHGAHRAASVGAGAVVGASIGAVVGASVVPSAFVVGVGAGVGVGVGAGAGIVKVCCCEAVDLPFNAAWIASHLPDLHVLYTVVKFLLLVINIKENKYIALM